MLWGGWLHTCAAFVFMAAMAVVFLAWIRHSLPGWRDIVWLAKGGGLLARGMHPPAWKLDAGQKILFWLVMLGGLSLSISGLALLFPGETALLARTFAAVNALGAYVGLARACRRSSRRCRRCNSLPSWHGIAALGLPRRHRPCLHAHAGHRGRVLGHGERPGRRELGQAAPPPVGRARDPQDGGGRGIAPAE